MERTDLETVVITSCGKLHKIAEVLRFLPQKYYYNRSAELNAFLTVEIPH